MGTYEPAFAYNTIFLMIVFPIFVLFRAYPNLQAKFILNTKRHPKYEADCFRSFQYIYAVVFFSGGVHYGQGARSVAFEMA